MAYNYDDVSAFWTKFYIDLIKTGVSFIDPAIASAMFLGLLDICFKF